MNSLTFNDIEWGTIHELIESLSAFGTEHLTFQQAYEIERRWLVKDGPALMQQISMEHNHPKDHRWGSYQEKRYIEAWLETNPELRIHRSFNQFGAPLGSFICLKDRPTDASGLSRKKYEFKTPDVNFDRILKIICDIEANRPFQGSLVVPVDLIIITYGEFSYEIRSADNGHRVWIDVEFKSEEDAKNFTLREEYAQFVDREITDNPGESMKAYWNQTRVFPYLGTR